MDILKLMASSNFIIVNRDLIKEFGTNGAILLGELASEYNYYHDNNRLSDDGMFFSTIENVENNTGLSRYQQKKAIDELKKKGVIDVELRGMPAKRYIRINTNKLFCSSLETSQQDSEKLTNKIARNSLTSSLETNKQDSEKLANYTLKTNEQDSEKLTTNNNKYKSNNKTNNNIYMGDNSESKPKHTSKRFIKPSIEEIKEYCSQNDLNIDCERFYDYYESNDWHVGKNKMKDWKATARNWNRNNYNSNNKNASNSPIYTDNNKVYEDDWFNDDLSDL